MEKTATLPAPATGTPIGETTPAELRRLNFAAGTMKPKVEAVCRFIESGGSFADAAAAGYAELKEAVIGVARELAQAIIRDGEGATKFITIVVEGGRNREECKKVGYAIGHSPLVKTAFFASDPNLGRILAAIGYADIEALNVDGVRVWLGSNGEEVLVAENGGRVASYREEDGARIMAAMEITVRVDLGRGNTKGTVYSCDFSYEYVKINADYRS